MPLQQMFRLLAAARRSSHWIAADFMLVHACILAALPVSVFAYTFAGQSDSASRIGAYFGQYYWRFFLPLSLLFPVVFAVGGLYTNTSRIRGTQKLLLLARSTGMAVAIFVLANYLVFRDDLIPRSVVICFSVFLPISMALLRFARKWLLALFTAEGEPAALARAAHGGRPPVLVLGGAGYIGSVLTRRLLADGYRVRILDSLVYGYDSIKEILDHPNFELIEGDSRNIQAVVSAVKGVDTIVDLAAIVGDPACEQDHTTALEINYSATRMLIEIAKGNGVERLIFASSCSVYGASDEIMDEDSPVCPISLYARTKVDSEQALVFAQSDTFHPVILRFATVFGLSHRPRFDLVVNLLSAKAHQEGIITIFNGEQWRPFIHVCDLAEAILCALRAPKHRVSGQIFNVGDSTMNFTLSDVAGHISRMFPDLTVEHAANTDRRNYRVSFEKIRRQLGFRTARSLEEGIRELKEAFDAGLIPDYRDPYYSNQKFLELTGSPRNTGAVDSGIMAAFAGTTEVPLKTVAVAVGRK